MGKRGPKAKPKISDVMVAEIIALFNAGDTTQSIASELRISDAQVKGILKKHGVTASSRQAQESGPASLSEEEEELLINFLLTQDSFDGDYLELQDAMVKFAEESEMNCNFTDAWRCKFLEQYKDRLPENIVAVFSSVQEELPTEEVMEDATEVTEEPITVEEGEAEAMEEIEEVEAVEAVEGEDVEAEGEAEADEIETEEAGEEKRDEGVSLEIDDDQSALTEAIKMAFNAFAAAGIPENRARNLLKNMNVPGFAEDQSENKGEEQDADKPGKAARSAGKAHSRFPAKSKSKSKLAPPLPKVPLKKTPLQTRVLEREFAKNSHIGAAQAVALAAKLELTGDQVLSWFRNKRQKRPSVVKKEIK